MTPPKPSTLRTVLRIAAPVFSLSLLAAYVVYTQHQANPGRRHMHGSKATQILEDLRQIDSAKDQYAIENNKKGADEVTWANVQAYLKKGTRLYTTNGKDIFGDAPAKPAFGEASPATKEVAPAPADTPTAAPPATPVNRPTMIAPGSKSIDSLLFRSHPEPAAPPAEPKPRTLLPGSKFAPIFPARPAEPAQPAKSQLPAAKPEAPAKAPENPRPAQPPPQKPAPPAQPPTQTAPAQPQAMAPSSKLKILITARDVRDALNPKADPEEIVDELPLPNPAAP